jgi:predicted DNA-binding transcriptional regulator YafY
MQSEGGSKCRSNCFFSYIQANPAQMASEMAATFKVTQRTIERWFRHLPETGLIEFIGSPKTYGY